MTDCELPVEKMLADVAIAESYRCQPPAAVVADLCCHVRALAEALQVADEQLAIACRRAQNYRNALFRVAARGGDWSYPDLLANVADALGLTVAQLQLQLS